MNFQSGNLAKWSITVDGSNPANSRSGVTVNERWKCGNVLTWTALPQSQELTWIGVSTTCGSGWVNLSNHTSEIRVDPPATAGGTDTDPRVISDSRGKSQMRAEMPVQKFRSIEEMNNAPVPESRTSDFERFLRHCGRRNFLCLNGSDARNRNQGE
jgi:hypothetical protein